MSDEIVLNTSELAKVQPTATKVTVPVFKLVPEGSPILFEPIEDFNFEEPPVNPNEFASSLVETCKANKGLGLSANQCGFKYRVFVVGYGDNYVAYFNPKITWQSDVQAHADEGCLSYPNLFLKITRPHGIEVEYQDYTGEKRTAKFEGLTARCILHEFDHMNGVVFTTRAKPLSLKTGLDKRMKLMRKYEKYSKLLQQQVKKLGK
jgi:peptide deformylase